MSAEVKIVPLPRCALCTRPHMFDTMCWNEFGELVCTDCNVPVQAISPEFDEKVLFRIKTRAFQFFSTMIMSD